MKIDPESEIGQIDYSKMAQMLDGIIIVRFIWGANKEAPMPNSSAKNMGGYVNHLVTYMSPDKLMVGIPTVGYEWELPYVEGKTTAYVLTINSILSLANDVGASIQFDEESQTPFIEFNQFSYGSPTPTQRIIWFTDARSINALLNIVNRFGLGGTGLWNIMIYYQQLWLIINSQYEIIKFLPDELQ